MENTTSPVVLADLPNELFSVIVDSDVKVYRALALTCKRFSASLTPSMVVDYKLAFGYTVEITWYYTKWLLDRKIHRIDGPAIEWMDGGKSWYVNGKRHRDDGPAVERADGGKVWWVNGKCHRLGGPAIEWADGGKEWWVHGNFQRRTSKLL